MFKRNAVITQNNESRVVVQNLSTEKVGILIFAELSQRISVGIMRRRMPSLTGFVFFQFAGDMEHLRSINSYLIEAYQRFK